MSANRSLTIVVLILATLFAYRMVAGSDQEPPNGRIDRLAANQLELLEAALSSDGPGRRPRQMVLRLEQAFVHRAVAAQLDPTGFRREHAVLECFRVGTDWTRTRLHTTSGRLQQRLDVSDLDLSGLQWDGRRLSGSFQAMVGRINRHRDYGEGENMHSMLKAQRRAVVPWELGGMERVRPGLNQFEVDAKVVPDRYILELQLSGFAGDYQEGRPPEPTDRQRLSHRETSALFSKQRRPIFITLVRHGNSWVAAEGQTPSWNRAIHHVDASGLELDDGRLRGRMQVTLLPDPWVPGRNAEGERIREITCELDVAIRSGALTGRFEARGEQGAYAGDVSGEMWQAINGAFEIDGVDGHYRGRLSGRMRPAPGGTAQLQALKLGAFDSAPGVKLGSEVAEAIDSYRQLHVRLLALEHLPVAEDETFATAAWMPTPICSDASTANAYTDAISRHAALACEEGERHRVGPQRAEDGDFGAFIGRRVLEDAQLPETMGQAGAQEWSAVVKWKALGPLEQQGRAPWRAVELPAVTPSPAVDYAVARPKLDGHIAVKRSWMPAATRGIEVLPNAEAWRDTWTQMAEYGSYGSYPANEVYYAHQNGRRSHRWYATTILSSPRKQEAWVAIRAADNGRLWVNERLVWDGGPQHDPSSISVLNIRLNEGENRLMIESGKQSISYHPPAPWDRSAFTFWVCTRGRPREQAALAEARKAEEDAYAARPARIAGYAASDGRDYAAAKPPLIWSVSKDMNVVWRHASGGGSAPPVIDSGKLFYAAEPHTLVCLDAKSGRELWRRDCNPLGDDSSDVFGRLQAGVEREEALEREAAAVRRDMKRNGDDVTPARLQALEAEYKRLTEERRAVGASLQPLRDRMTELGIDVDRDGLGPRAGGAPVVHDGKVWVSFGTGMAACFDFDGERIWQKRTGLTWRGRVEFSPLLCGDTFYVVGRLPRERGQREYQYRTVALDAETGETRWESDPIQMSLGLAPVRVVRGAQQRYCLVTADGTVIDGASGRTLYRGLFDLDGPVTPVVRDNVAYFVATRLGQAAFRFWLDEAGRIGCRRLWEIRRAGSSSPQITEMGLVHEGLLYIPRSSDENGGHHPVAWDQVDVYEAEMGQHLARPNPVTYDSASPLPLVRAGEYIVASDSGTRGYGGRSPYPMVAFLCPSDQPDLAHRVAMHEGKLRCAPVFDGPRMVLRLGGELVCIGKDSPDIRRTELDTLARSAMALIGTQPRMEAMHVAPAGDLDPPPGVPVCELVPNVPPTDWLMAGPYPMLGDDGPSDERLASLRPEPGDKLEVSGQDAAFGPLPKDVRLLSGMTMLYRSEGTFYTPTFGLSLNEAVKGEDRRCVYFYTVVDCREETSVMFRTKNEVRAWLAGRAFGSEQALRLDVGYYPLLIEAGVEAIPPVGKIILKPRFNPILSAAKAEADWLARIARHEAILREAAKVFGDRGTGIRANRLLDALEASRKR